MMGKKQKKLITEELTWEQHVICGNQSYQSGRADEALLEYEKALILNPNNSFIYHNRGILYYNLENNQEALFDYSKAIELNPLDQQIYNNRGILYSDLARQEDALDDFNKAIELDPDFSDAYHNRAMLFVDLGKTHEALNDFDKAIELKASSKLYKNRGILLLNLNRFDEALKDFTEGINLTKNDSTLYFNSAISLQSLNRNEEALVHYDQSIKLNSNDQKAYKSRGILYTHMNEPNLAISDLTKAIQLKQDDFNAYYHRANQYWKQNQLNLALYDFNKSIRLNPKYQNAYDCRGSLYLELGQAIKAEQDFKMSIQLNSKSSMSYNSLGQQYIQILGNYFVNQGNYQEALKHYQEAIQLDPNNSIYLINLGELHLKMNDFQQATLYIQQANSHLNFNQNLQYLNILNFISKMLPIFLEIINSFEKEQYQIQTYPLESNAKLELINEIARIKTSVENKLKTILQPISLQSKQYYLNNQIEQLKEIALEIQINFSLIQQSLQKQQQLEIQQEENKIQQNSNYIIKISTEIANLKNAQNNNKYIYFKSLCCNFLSFMSFCLDVYQSDKIINESQNEKELFLNQLCAFKAENYLIQNDLLELTLQIIFKELGYFDDLKKIIIDKNFAQLYFIENDYSKKLEIEFHLLAIDLALKELEVPEIKLFFESVEKISTIQMKEISIASNIFWKKGIQDSIKIIQFIDNNINKIQSYGLQYIKMFNQELVSEEVIVIHESFSQPLMAVPSLKNEQTTYCSFCLIQ